MVHFVERLLVAVCEVSYIGLQRPMTCDAARSCVCNRSASNLCGSANDRVDATQHPRELLLRTPERGVYGARQRVEREGLLQEPYVRVEPAVVNDGVFRVARHEQYGQRRP